MEVQTTKTKLAMQGNFSVMWFVWWRGVVVSAVRHLNEVTLRRARLVPGWVTVCGRVYPLDM